ncbi:Phosphate-binding protein PstS 1 precursor [Planctomycetes bacterium Poly30]|uniref:Phosphate-binding protein n=1 Tax=Saltatorellus ferox TaxID=2528018 RepID=A0A518EKK2_9BACT|nr:Phosphate-binding protein PstS 1 precursor [Planctomycetes bacterium Poly30]
MKRTLVLTALASLSTLGLSACGGSAHGGNHIQNKGSDTLVNVAQAWAEEYSKVQPDVSVAVSGGGSGVGISAMINGTVDIANASRAMKQKEIDQAKGNGIDPVEHIVGFDALAVYVHKDNPIESITLEQLADIYGENGTVTRWSQLGVTMPSNTADEIVRISRQNNSGTYSYFRDTVLGTDGSYKLGSNDLHGSKDVVDTVEKTPGAIGYSGLAYANEHVKLVPVSTNGGAPVSPTTQTAVDGSYPIARPLFMYTAGEPTGKVKAYLDWILSPTGQKIIEAKGYAPVGLDTAAGAAGN